MKKYEIILIRSANLCKEIITFKEGIAYNVLPNDVVGPIFELHSVGSIIEINAIPEVIEKEIVMNSAIIGNVGPNPKAEALLGSDVTKPKAAPAKKTKARSKKK